MGFMCGVRTVSAVWHAHAMDMDWALPGVQAKWVKLYEIQTLYVSFLQQKCMAFNHTSLIRMQITTCGGICIPKLINQDALVELISLALILRTCWLLLKLKPCGKAIKTGLQPQMHFLTCKIWSAIWAVIYSVKVMQTIPHFYLTTSIYFQCSRSHCILFQTLVNMQ